MTLVVGINLGNCAIITADSRVTTRWPGKLTTRVDCCQKVFRISETTITGFCGDLIAIADVLSTFAQMYQLHPDLINVETLFKRLPLALKLGSQEFRRISGRLPDLGLIVAGRNSHGAFDMFLCQSPDYDIQALETGDIAIMGSGTPIVEHLSNNLQSQLPDLMRKPSRPFDAEEYGPRVLAPWITWIIAEHVECTLKTSGISSVGRAFHALCIDSETVRPIPLDIARLVDVDKKELVIGTRFEGGSKWIQYTADGTEIELVSPIDVVLNDKLLTRDRILQALR